MPSFIEPKDKTESISKEGSERYKFIQELSQKVRRDDDAREIWKNKQIVSANQRLGTRRRTNNPGTYSGHKEVPIPVTDKIIKKLKSLYVSVATFSKKQVVVSLEEGVEQPQSARTSAAKIEKAINGLIRKRSFKWTKTISLFVDYFLENGQAVFKIIEKFFSKTSEKTIDLRELDEETLSLIKGGTKDDLRLFFSQREGLDPEDKDDKDSIEDIVDQIKSGEDVIRYTKHLVYSEPTVIPERGIRVIVPRGTTELQRAPRVTHDMWMTIHELRKMAEQGVYDKLVIDSLNDDEGTSDDSLIANAQDLVEGISSKDSDGSSELFNIRESQAIYDGQIWVFTWIERKGNTSDQRDNNPEIKEVKTIQEIKLPYEHGFYTYVKHDNEIKSPRWYSSRGVPEQIRGLHYVMEKMMNARIIRDEYNNNPMYRISRSLGMSGDEIRFKPGQIIEAEQNEIEQINKAITTDVSSERIEQQAKAYIEEYQSIVDFSVKSAVNQGSARTATEVSAIRGAAQQQLNTDVAIFLETLSEVAHHIYLILQQSVSGPRVIGGVLLTPDDFQIKATVSWVGSLEASDHNIQMQKAMQRIQILTQMAMPLGLVTQEDAYNAFKDWLDKDPDVEDPDRYITMPQEIQSDQAEEQQQEIMMMQGGFNPRVKPDDQHATHIAVMEEYINSPQGQGLFQANEQFAQSFQQHLNIHLEAEKTLKQGGNTDDPRRKRVLQTFTGSGEGS